MPKTQTVAIIPFRSAINVTNTYKVKDSRREVKGAPVVHKVRPLYLGATMVRAANMALTLEEAGVIKPADRVRVRNTIHSALDDARSAGFSAGCAFMRTKLG